MTKLFDLSGRTALVTGSSRGLGRAIAEGLAQAGADIVLNGRAGPTLAQTANALRSAGHEVREASFDVTDEAGVQAAFRSFDEDGIEIDILVNNAGIQHRQPMVELARATVTPYTVAKGGIKMLTRGMAAEWAKHGIQANAIGPGYMLTDMNEALVNDPKFDAWVKARTPAGRWGRPEELVGAAVFLASRASDYVNGQIIYVDGGMISVL